MPEFVSSLLVDCLHLAFTIVFGITGAFGIIMMGGFVAVERPKEAWIPVTGFLIACVSVAAIMQWPW